MNVLLKNRYASGAIGPYRIVKHGGTDDQFTQASAATDALVGVKDGLPAVDGERCDVVVIGLTDVEYGGNVTRGALLTSDADGKAITAAPAAGANVRIIGEAWVSGVAGDIGKVLLAPGQIQG